jgi:hypothetical protein
LADWTTPATSHFGACLRTVANAAATWTPDAACGASNGAFWNAVPTTASQIASASTGVNNGTANLRFGMRTSSTQPAGDYIAPVTFTVVAP